MLRVLRYLVDGTLHEKWRDYSKLEGLETELRRLSTAGSHEDLEALQAEHVELTRQSHALEAELCKFYEYEFANFKDKEERIEQAARRVATGVLAWIESAARAGRYRLDLADRGSLLEERSGGDQGDLASRDDLLDPAIRFWLSEPGRADVEVTFALRFENRQKTSIAYLGVSRCGSSDELLESPALALRPLDHSLLEAVRSAWEASGLGGVMWTIRQLEREDEERRGAPIVGASLSLAAHVGLRLLAGRRVADPGCLVIGRVNGQTVVATGDEVSTEAKKVADLGRVGLAGLGGPVSKVVIANGAPQPGAIPGLTVKKVARVDQAVEEVSGFATELLGYCAAMIRGVEGQRIALPGEDRTLLDVNVDRDVIQLTARDGRFVRDEDPLEPRERRKSWNDALTEFAESRRRLATLLAPSGSGKSQLIKTSLRNMAAGAIEAVGSGAPLTTIAVPVEATCSQLAEAFKADGSIDTALRGLVTRKCVELDLVDASSRNLVEHIADAVSHAGEPGDQGVWLFLDAYDQTTEVDAFEQALQELLKRPLRLILTSRRHAYEARLRAIDAAVHELAEFDANQVSEFLQHWFGDDEKRGVVERLLNDVPAIRDLAGTPFLLTLVCRNSSNKELAADPVRTTLYRVAVADLASRQRVAGGPQPYVLDRSRGADLVLGLGPVLHDTFEEFLEHPERPDESLKASVLKDYLRRYETQLPDPLAAFGRTDSQGVARANALLKEVSDKGLLRWIDDECVDFPHRSIGEYLAAVGLVDRILADGFGPFTQRLGDTRWRDVLKFAVGELGHRRDRRTKAGELVLTLCDRAFQADGPIVAGEGVADGGTGCVPPEVLEKLRKRLLRIMRADGINPKARPGEAFVPKVRAEAGKTLSRIGDPRFSEDFFFLPVYKPDLDENDNFVPEEMLGFIEIPAGEFWMGSNLPPEKVKELEAKQRQEKRRK